MVRLRWFVAATLAASLGACSLVSDLDALSNGVSSSTGAPATTSTSASSSSASGGGATSSSTAAGGGGTGGVATTTAAASGGGAGGGNDCPGTGGPEGVRIGVGQSSYCIDATEVRVKDYLEFLDVAANDDSILDDQAPECVWNASLLPNAGYTTWWADITQAGEENDPIRLVDWCDATAFCKWAGKRLCGKRTGGPVTHAEAKTVDAQWFHTCSKNGQQPYPYGQQSPNATGAWPHEPSGVCVDGRGGPAMPPDLHTYTDAAGSNAGCEGGFPGVFDMSGNVAEWTDSCVATGGPPEDDSCLSQGGAYNFLADACGCGFSEPKSRDLTSVGVGFRCCSL